MSQRQACSIFDINPRTFRRWKSWQPSPPQTAWNKLLPHERHAIIDIAWMPALLGKPVTHLFVHGIDHGIVNASLSTFYRVLNAEKLVHPRPSRKRTSSGYVSAHELLDSGFQLLCYDVKLFRTDTGVPVWAIPVLLLPFRFLLTVGHALHSVRSKDLRDAVDEAILQIPDRFLDTLVTHSDRGAAMKSRSTREHLNELGVAVHFGRPHTPDDEPWIEALNKSLAYHRDCPEHFPQVADILRWFRRFPDIHNNEPHSALSFVSPAQALLGQKEVILAQRTRKLLSARRQRLAYYHANGRPGTPVSKGGISST